ncbi:MAG: hypothetical protein IJW26_04110 [Clostridia bacterium]|nr:hypothetical protein [Clostridia bacterium]
MVTNSYQFKRVNFTAKLISLLLSFFLFITLISSVGCSTMLSRDINKNDYSYTTSQGLTSYTITITPKVDMTNCDVMLKLYSSSNEEVYADTISKTNLKKGNSYSYNFEFGFMNALVGNSVRLNVTGKCPLIS